MADNNVHFGTGSGEGKHGGVDHDGELLRIIGNDNHSVAQKMDAIENHPHLTTAHKAKGMDFLTKQAGGGVKAGGTGTGTNRGLGPRPNVPHSEVDYDGSAVNLTDSQREANSRARAAQENWDAQSSAKPAVKPETPALIGRAPFSGGGYRPKVAQATMKTKEISSKLSGLHSILSAHAESANSIKTLSPDHREYLKAAKSHLDDAKTHMGIAQRTLGSNTPDTNEQAVHFGHAMTSLSNAHEMLSHGPLQRALKRSNLTAELPSADSLATMAGHVSSMRAKGASGVPGAKRPYKSVKVGKATISTANISQEDVKSLEETGGKESILTQKVKKAVRGTAPGTADTSDSAVNPNRRGSSKRVDVRYSSQANKIGQNPVFGESGSVGRVTGDTPKGLTSDPAKKNPNTNRGGRGGAV